MANITNNPVSKKRSREEEIPVVSSDKKACTLTEKLRRELESFSQKERISQVVQALLFCPDENSWSQARIDQFFPEEKTSTDLSEKYEEICQQYKNKIHKIDNCFTQDILPFLKKMKGLEEVACNSLAQMAGIHKWFIFENREPVSLRARFTHSFAPILFQEFFPTRMLLPSDRNNHQWNLMRVRVTFAELDSLKGTISKLNQPDDRKKEVIRNISDVLLGKSDSLDLKGLNLIRIPEGIRYLTNLKKLDLSNNRLPALPDWIGELTNLEEVNLSENKMVIFPENINKLSKLTTLYLKENEIQKIPESFTSMQSLRTLDLSENPLGEWHFPPKLTSLDLSYNEIGEFPEAILQLKELEKLELNDMNLNYIPKEFASMRSLRHLSICHNDFNVEDAEDLIGYISHLTNLETLELGLFLEKLPDDLKTLKNLRNLHLETCDIEEIPPFLATLPKLVRVDLTGNRLKKLPEDITDCKNLESLLIEENYINELPQKMGNLTNLKFFNCSANQLTILPDSFSDLSKLETLSCHGNRLSQLPEKFGALKSLHTFIASHNNLERLPNSIGELQKLKIVKLQQNRLSALPDGFSLLSNLEELNIQDNEIKQLPNNFGRLKSLQKLNIMANKLESLPDSFADLSNLELLNLEANQISGLNESFCKLRKLRGLSLSKNELRSLPKKMGLMMQLRDLRVEGNRLRELPETLFPILPTMQFVYGKDELPESVVARIDREVVAFRQNHYRTKPKFTLKHLAIFTDKEMPDLSSLSEEEKEALDNFVGMIADSATFPKYPLEISNHFFTFFEFAQEKKENDWSHPEFRALFFTACNEGSVSCGDRVALYLNQMYGYYSIHSGNLPNKIGDTEEKMTLIDLVMGLEKLELLHKKGSAFIGKLKLENPNDEDLDPIEIFLALQVKLEKDLQLPLLIRELRFVPHKKLTAEKIKEIKEQVVEETKDELDFLVASQLWQKYIISQNQKDYEALVSEISSMELEEVKKKEDEDDETFQNRVQMAQIEFAFSIENKKKQFFIEKTKPLLPKRKKTMEIEEEKKERESKMDE